MGDRSLFNAGKRSAKNLIWKKEMLDYTKDSAGRAGKKECKSIADYFGTYSTLDQAHKKTAEGEHLVGLTRPLDAKGQMSSPGLKARWV